MLGAIKCGADEKISDAYGGLCLMSETSIEIKHEGGVVCYELKSSNKPFEPASPTWLEKSDSQQQKNSAAMRSRIPTEVRKVRHDLTNYAFHFVNRERSPQVTLSKILADGLVEGKVYPTVGSSRSVFD